MKKSAVKMGKLGLALLLVGAMLASSGVCYARLSGSLEAAGEAFACPAVIPWVVSNDDGQTANAGGYNPIDPCDNGLDPSGPVGGPVPPPAVPGVCPDQWNKDVGFTSATISPDGFSISINVNNAYPYYHPTIFFSVCNNHNQPGTITSIDLVNLNQAPGGEDMITASYSGIEIGQVIEPYSCVVGALGLQVEQIAMQASVYPITLQVNLEGAPAPAVKIEKQVSVNCGSTWLDADTAPGPEITIPGTVKFRVIVTNIGDVPLTNIVVTDDTGLQFQVPATLGKGESYTSPYIALTSVLGLHKNTATVTAKYGQTTVTASDPAHYTGIKAVPCKYADLEVIKTVDNHRPVKGTNVTFTVTAKNNGPSDATGVVVHDILSWGLTFVSATTSTGSYNSQTGIWTIGNLASGATATMKMVATAYGCNNTAVISGDQPDPNPGNNSATVGISTIAGPVVTPKADLAVTKTVDNAMPLKGSMVTFTITAKNNGPSDATGVVVHDVMSTGLTFISANPATGTYNSHTGIWSIGNLANGASVSMQLVAAAYGCTNTAAICGDQSDPVTGNNSASVSILTTTPPDTGTQTDNSYFSIGTIQATNPNVTSEEIRFTTPDGRIVIIIPANTEIVTGSGESFSQVTAVPLSAAIPLPPQKAMVALYDFGPDGATFDPGITLTMHYDPAELPAGAGAGQLTLAYWDGTEWKTLDTTLDIGNRTLTAHINRFSTYGMMVDIPAAAETPGVIAGLPEQASDTGAAATPQPGEQAEPASLTNPVVSQAQDKAAPSQMLIVLLILSVSFVIVLILFLVRQRKREARA